MAPPTVAIVVGVTAVVSLTVAFHKFIYEPHLASKIEVAIANWLESRRQKRRQAAAYREVHDERDDDRQDKPTDTTPPVEMDRMVKEEVAGWRSVRPLTLNEMDGISELRRRNTPNHPLEEESVWTLKPTIYEPLTPTLAASRAQSPFVRDPLLTTMVSHTSTPSTVESSLLNLASPSSLTALSPLQNVPPRTLSPGSTASQHDPLADSILSNPAHETLFSPDSASNQSHFRITPRGLEVHLAPKSGVDEGEGNPNPLSQVYQPPITRSPRSPLASTIYESFTNAQASGSPLSPPSTIHSPQVFTPQFVVQSPLSDSLSLVEHPTAPASTASWSDIGSTGAEGDRDELFVGSDAESWARARNVRRT